MNPSGGTVPPLAAPPGRLASSFRDPSGRVVLYRDRVLRFVNRSGIGDLTTFLASPIARKLVQDGLVIGTRQLSDGDTAELRSDALFAEITGDAEAVKIFEHERVSFPSYPYEWPAEMLFSAGQLTIDLARQLLSGGFGIKDATPYNVLFCGPNPVFVDVLSFERRNPRDSIWLPYAQFVRTFLLPLLAAKHFGVAPAHTLLTRRDGLEPEEVYRWLSPRQKLSPQFFSLVSMPCWLASKYERRSAAIHTNDQTMDTEKAQFILDHLFKATARNLSNVSPARGAMSAWTEYMGSNNNYSTEHFAAKERFVREVIDSFRPRRVLDIGCNNGHFSEIAARAGAEVVGLDYDPIVLGEVWRRAKAGSLNILPLNVNLCRPTPGTGWRNEECPSFIDRARGAFDCLLMLAVIHHMLVTERVPLPEIVDMAAELTRDLVMIEFVGPEDSMFRRIARGRDHLHAGLNTETFETAWRRHFDILRTQHLQGTERWLYLLQRRSYRPH